MSQINASVTTSQPAATSNMRTLNFEPFVDGVGFVGMAIRIPRRTKAPKVGHFGYFVRKIDAAFGLGFSMKKAGAVKDGEESEYAINIDLVQGKHSCECKGFLQHGHCKHTEALLALVKAGKIEAPKPEAEPQRSADSCPECGGNINNCGCFDVM